jgi:hypothetical protein
VIYAPEPLPALDDVDGAIRHALDNPIDSEPLRARLFPGMRLTIAFDDVSLPLPKMRRPDIRQRVIEAVLDLAAEAGVDDVQLIAALALHRRMTEGELRHAVGDRVYDAFAPLGQLTQFDAEDPDGVAFIGTTDRGEDVEISKRAAESDLVVYVNINLVAMDGGWKSTAIGLASYRSLRHHHNPATMEASRSFMDHHRSELHHSTWRMGKVLVDAGVEVFQIETNPTPTHSRSRSSSCPSASGNGRRGTVRCTSAPPPHSASCRSRQRARSSTRSRRHTKRRASSAVTSRPSTT